METLIAALIVLSASMGSYGTPPAPQAEDHGSNRGAITQPVQEAAPRQPGGSGNPHGPTPAPKTPEGYR